jgi:cephalosporin hydroxylase
MVFIDGDHAYSSVARDIRDYAPLVVDGGYICGDDLELQETILNFK